MSFEALPERLTQVRAEIARIAEHPVTIVAVTKGFGTDAIHAALAAGLADIGENRVQEAIQKQDALRGQPGIRWHLIGHLQRNKAKVVPGRFELVHSVDSLELARELDRRASDSIRVLLQVNVAGESQKSGCPPQEARGLARQIAALGQLRLEGLMTLAPLTDDVEVQRRAFRGLRLLRDTIKEDGVWLPTLSMGMSGDYATAVAEGATMIRLGTALFGPREKTETSA
ncbi:MAG: YggS family pyridoxal phosphate-dependent enzyme [Gemmatimonadetes bacterium]|nr:MAG: YggS family pyridoxal phosphate-dependent enzyme [Gemmatimonadota bacterium]